MKRIPLYLALAPLLGLGLSACGGSGSSALPSAAVSAKTSTLSGTVPGTLILAYGDNGSYYQVASFNDGTAMHPFELELPAGMGYRLVMVTNETAPQAEWIYTPIAFYDASGQLQTRFVFEAGQNFDIGYVALQTDYSLANCPGLGECVVASYIMDEHASDGSVNPLTLMDADEDGTPDFEDDDQGGYQYADSSTDPLDIDDDGIINCYDDDIDGDGLSNDVDDDDDNDGVADSDEPSDSDDDGLPDSIDANPGNDVNDDNSYSDSQDADHDGYLDGDSNHDGYEDDDANHDGVVEASEQPDDSSSPGV